MATLGIPQNTIEVLQKYNFNFQKKFGQNFLIDTHVLEKIIEESGITKDDFVLEIGPGIGTMTQYLCENAREVATVEIDKNLIPILADTLSAYDNVEVINDDILKVDINKLAEEKTEESRSKLWRIFHIISRHRSLWDYLKAMCRSTALRSWCRKKWQTVCRWGRERKNMGHSPCSAVLCETRDCCDRSAELFYAPPKCRKCSDPSHKT